MATYSIYCGPVTTVAAQTASFGALTIASAGGFKPVDVSGDVVSLASYDSLVSGSLGAYTPSITSGKLVFSGAAGAPNGAVLRCGLIWGGTVDITISSVADTYSVSTSAELSAARTAITSAGGKTVLMRRGTYDNTIGNNIFGTGTTYAAEIVYQGEGTADTGKGTKITPYINCTTMQKAKYKNLEVSSATGYPAPIEVSGTTADITVEDCYLHGKYYDPFATSGVDYSNCNGITVVGTPTNFVAQRNLIEHVDNGISISSIQPFNLDLNEIRYFTADSIQVGIGSPSSGSRNISRNVIYANLATLADSHSDGNQWTSISADPTQTNTGITIRQNVIFDCPALSIGAITSGICCYRDTSSPLLGRQFTAAVMAGNIIVIGNQNAVTLTNTVDGFYGYNTVVRPTSAGSNTPTLTLGQYSSAGTIKFKHNASDANNPGATGATYDQSNQVSLGRGGATISYDTAFNWADPTVAATSYTELLANLTPRTGSTVDTNDAGAIGSGYGTFGSPRNATGWANDTGLEV